MITNSKSQVVTEATMRRKQNNERTKNLVIERIQNKYHLNKTHRTL